jgi:hypothetical protein
MSQTLTLSDSVYRKLTRSAAQRGVSVESWLELLSDAAQRSASRQRDRDRVEKIERILQKCRSGAATDQQRATLDRLVDEEYGIALERADARIAAKRNGATKTTRPRGRRSASVGRPRGSSAK